MSSTSDSPEVGDPVVLRGKIVSIHEGVALVEVYRTYPVGISVPVQCGALEYDETVGDGGSPDEIARISSAVAEATENPGRTMSADDPWKGFPLDSDEVER